MCVVYGPFKSDSFQNAGGGIKFQILMGVCGGPFNFFFGGGPSNAIKRVERPNCMSFFRPIGFKFNINPSRLGSHGSSTKLRQGFSRLSFRGTSN